MRRLLPVLIFLILLFIVNNCFCQGVLWCDIDFGCWLSPDYKPTLPAAGVCHASSPSAIALKAKSYWTNGNPCPTDWEFELESFPYETDDCSLNGCHQHPRVFQGNNMLTSIGGLRYLGPDWSSALYEEDQYLLPFEVAKPEASGIIYLLVRAAIPPGCIRDHLLDYNPGWRFENNDPNSGWIYTTISFPYQVLGLVELPDGDNYIKNSNLENHVAHQFYGTPQMITKVQDLANTIRTKYNEGTGYNVRASFNDMSLEYGGIFDYHSQWNCDHRLHREGKSVDLNTTSCLTCDSGQSGCENKSSTDDITLKHKDGTTETLTVKTWIDRLARGKGLYEWHTDSRIHLDCEEPGGGR